ncbi:hypothetical protein C8R43DRAFT_946947 [Mycena crocata]|nr:hypothetical protein C8R43DRAFT_946947 [Mycena crocata]
MFSTAAGFKASLRTIQSFRFRISVLLVESKALSDCFREPYIETPPCQCSLPLSLKPSLTRRFRLIFTSELPRRLELCGSSVVLQTLAARFQAPLRAASEVYVASSRGQKVSLESLDGPKTRSDLRAPGVPERN